MKYWFTTCFDFFYENKNNDYVCCLIDVIRHIVRNLLCKLFNFETVNYYLCNRFFRVLLWIAHQYLKNIIGQMNSTKKTVHKVKTWKQSHHDALVSDAERSESDKPVPPTRDSLLGGFVKLTDREIEIIRWLMEGKSSWDIGKILSISERTVKFHVNNICIKLNAVNRTHAVAKAILNNIV